MGTSAGIALLLALAVVLANLPFLGRRFLVFGPDKQQRPAWTLLELLLAYATFIGAGWLLEQHYGQIAPQSWQFYAVSLCLFGSMAFPGFVLRYLFKK